MTTTSQPGWFKFRWIKDDGTPAQDWVVYTYQAGTSTPLSTFADEAGTQSNGTSFTLDDRGEANVWLQKAYTYKFVVKDDSGNIQDTIDNIAPVLLKDDVIVKYSDGDTVSDINDNALIGFGVVTNAVNYLKFSNATLTADPTISVVGGATNISLDYMTKGSGVHKWLDGASNELFTSQSGTANAVNNWSVGNSATGVAPTLLVQGDDTNVSGNIQAKGTGGINLLDGSGNKVFVTGAGNASAVNYITANNGATSFYPFFRAEGSDTNIGIKYQTKGSGTHIFYDGSSAKLIETQAGIASAVNYLGVTNAATGSGPILSGLGSDSNIDVTVQPKGTGALKVLGTSAGPASIKLAEDTDNGTNVTGFVAPSSLAGDVIYTLPSADGSASQILKTDGAKGLSWTNNIAGIVVQQQYFQTGTAATGSTTLPADNTVPQNTEGFQVMSVTITPTSAANDLIIEATIPMSHSSASAQTLTAAMFKDAEANCRTAGMMGYNGGFSASSGVMVQVNLWARISAASTSSQTFKVRIGSNIAGTTTFCGSGGSQLLGGFLTGSIRITEVTT